MDSDGLNYLPNIDESDIEQALDMNILNEIIGLNGIKVLKENVNELRDGDKDYTKRLGQARTRKLYLWVIWLLVIS